MAALRCGIAGLLLSPGILEQRLSPWALSASLIGAPEDGAPRATGHALVWAQLLWVCFTGVTQ